MVASSKTGYGKKKRGEKNANPAQRPNESDSKVENYVRGSVIRSRSAFFNHVS